MSRVSINDCKRTFRSFYNYFDLAPKALIFDGFYLNTANRLLGVTATLGFAAPFVSPVLKRLICIVTLFFALTELTSVPRNMFLVYQ